MNTFSNYSYKCILVLHQQIPVYFSRTMSILSTYLYFYPNIIKLCWFTSKSFVKGKV